MVQTLRKTAGQLLKRQTAIPLLWIYSRETQRCIHTETCKIIFIAVLFLVTQSCPSLCDPMDYSPPGSSVHGDSWGKNTRMGSLPLLQGIFPTQELNQGLLYCRWILYQLSYQGSPHGLCNKYMFVLEITPCSAYCCVARTLFEEHVFKTGILLLAYRSQMWSIPEISLNVHGEYYGKIILY